MTGVRYVPRHPPVHQIKEQAPQNGGVHIIMKCGKVLTHSPKERLTRATIWWTRVTCKECQP